MTFFEQQARARRNTTVLVLLFVLGVAAVVLVLDLVVAAAYAAWLADDLGSAATQTALPRVPGRLVLWTTVLTLAVIAGRSLTTVYGLRAGGAAVMRMCGGVPVDRSTQAPEERRLLNLVEEMAIASGVAVPRVYVLPGEPGINALAAGYAPNQSVIAVTKGALARLGRDELQGVIAHEFSHILNGDARTSIHMVGVLSGLLFIGAIGQFLVRSAATPDGHDRRSDVRGRLVFIVIGLAIMVVGSIGLFFGRVIKAAVSRQREFLADAAAVQFTRNPDGLAAALATIGGLGQGSRVTHRHAETLSHMFFAMGIDLGCAWLFATHPPITLRIERINPRFLASLQRPAAARRGPGEVRAAPDAVVAMVTTAPADVVAAPPPRAPEAPTREVGEATAMPPARTPGRVTAAQAPVPEAGEAVAAPAVAPTGSMPRPPRRELPSAAVLATVGNPGPEHVGYASRLLAALPEPARTAIDTANGAQALILAFALAEDEPLRSRQLSMIERAGSAALSRQTAAMAEHGRALPRAARLPVVMLALPSIRERDRVVRDAFMHMLATLIEADASVTLEEFVLYTIVVQQLRPGAGRAEAVKHRSIGEVGEDARLIVSLLAHAGAPATGSVDAAFQRGIDVLGLPEGVAVPLAAIELAKVSQSLERLRRLAPVAKRTFVEACLATAMADQAIRLAEAELLRAVAVAIDCPIPPILDSIEAGVSSA